MLIERVALRDPTELIAYVRPERVGSIRSDPNAILFAISDSQGQRVPIFFASRTELRPGIDLYFGLLLAVGLPCVLLAWLAATAGAFRRRERAATLVWIGAPPAATGFLAAAETLMLSIPGIAFAAATFVPISGRLREIPIVGRPVFQGDLAVELTEFAIAAGTLLLVIGLVSAVAGVRAAQTSASAPRPTAPARWRGRFRIVARALIFSLALVSLVAYVVVPAESAFAQPVMGATAISLLLAIPLVCTALLAGVAGVVVRLPGPLALLAGRQLARVGNRDVRPFAVAGVVLGTVVALTGLYARHSDPIVGPAPPTQAAMLRWSAPRSGDVKAIDRALSGAEIFAATRTDHGLRVHAPCEAVARLIRASCSGERTTAAASLEQQLGVAPGGVEFVGATESPSKPAAPLDQRRDHPLVPNGEHDHPPEPSAPTAGSPGRHIPDAALVVTQNPDRDLAERIYTAATVGEIPRPLVDVRSWTGIQLPMFVRWLSLIGVLAGGAIVLALIVAQADTVTAQSREARVLPRLGMAPARFRRMIVMRHAILAACCYTVGLGSGLAIAFTLTHGSDYHFQPLWAAYGAEGVIALAAVALGGGLAWIATGDSVVNAYDSGSNA
ncbi:MAG TPA: hypothetical protein VFL61_01565 [Gaiellaceae bacterium]|nr:hypothetical protein [Gaiellaceae bacterium]